MRGAYRIGVALAAVGLTAACVGGWVAEDSPTSEDLYAVWGATGTDVFAVGNNGTVLRRQNARWRELDSGIEEDLRGVWGTGVEHVVAVGFNCAALEFNGEPEPPPDGGEAPPDLRPLDVSTCSNFYGIDGPSSAFVVGDGRAQWYGGNNLSDGRDFDTGRMLGVSMPDSGNIFAVGEGGAFWHKQGDSWNLREIALCPVELVNGECPKEPMPPVLWDVWVGEAGQGALVGTFGGIWMYPPPEGSAWSPLDAGFANELRSVHGWVNTEAQKDPTTLYAVGTYGVVVRLRGNKVVREALGTNENLYGVWVSPDGEHVYTVGAGGTIVHFTK